MEERVPSERRGVARVVAVGEKPATDVPNTSAAGFTTPPYSRVSSERATSPMASGACGARALILLQKKRRASARRRRAAAIFRGKKRTKSVGGLHPRLRVPARCAPRWWRGTSAAASRPTTSVPRNPRAGLCRSPSDARRSNATVERRNASRSTPSPRARPPTAVATTTAAAARRARRRATRRTGPT